MKKLSKLLFALVTVLCVALSALAFAGCQGETGATGPQGPVGETGAPGKSAYEIAVENGFEGTVDEWLESLKGQAGAPGQDLTACEHTYGDVIMMIEPTGVTDGFGYEECSECGNQHIVVIPKIAGIDVRNPLALTLDENGKCVVENLGGTMYVSFPATQSGRVQVALSSIGEYAYDITTEYLLGFYAQGYEGIEENEVREYYKEDTVIVKLEVHEWYENFEVAVNYMDSAEEFEHTFTIIGSNYAGVTAIEILGTNPWWGGTYTVAKGELVDGQVTLSFVPGIYQINLIGLNTDDYVMAEDYSSGLETELPVDGSNDQGSDYTYYFLGQNNYTINVVKDGAPVKDAKVGFYNAKAFYASGVPSEYDDSKATEIVTTDADGSAIVTISDDMYYINGETTVGFFYLAKLESLGFAEYADNVVLNLEEDNGIITITIKTAEIATLGTTEASLIFNSLDAYESVAYATVNVATAGDYVLSIANAINTANYDVLLDGEVVANATGASNAVSLTLTGLEAGDYNVAIKVDTKAATLNGMAPTATFDVPAQGSEIVGTELFLGETIIEADGMYTFIAIADGDYVFTDMTGAGCFTMATNEVDSMNWNFMWDSMESDSYTATLEAGEYFSFYLTYYPDSNDDYPTLKIECPAITALTVGNNEVSEDGYYSFTAEEAGTYTFSDTDSMGAVQFCASYDDYMSDTYLWDSYYTSTYSVDLEAGETIYVFAHYYNPTTVVIEKA